MDGRSGLLQSVQMASPPLVLHYSKYIMLNWTCFIIDELYTVIELNWTETAWLDISTKLKFEELLIQIKKQSSPIANPTPKFGTMSP